MRHETRNRAGAILGLAATVALAGCGARQAGSAPVGVAPGLVVERFLQAANRAAPLPGSQACRSAEALETMGRLFGTVDGSVLETRDRVTVDRWMCALASVLRHDDYALVGEGVVPGRTETAQQVIVRIDLGPETKRVPFLVIQSGEGTWLIEQVDVEAALGQG